MQVKKDRTDLIKSLGDAVDQHTAVGQDSSSNEKSPDKNELKRQNMMLKMKLQLAYEEGMKIFLCGCDFSRCLGLRFRLVSL